MSSFAGLNISMKGLYASQKSIYVIGHNMSNADTEGYSRQTTVRKASLPIKTYGTDGMIGTGVDTTSVIRFRNEFLDRRYWNENIRYGEWSVKNNALSEMEAIMNETSEEGLASVFSDFSDALEDLAKEPESDQARTVVMENGRAFCLYLNTSYSNLAELRKDYNSNVKVKVNEINSYAKQICDLNQQIYKSELDGSTANDLRDQRALLVDKLSAIADIQVNEVNAGTLDNGKKDVRFQVILDGVSLVNHFQYNEMECYTIDDGSVSDGMYGVRWAKTGMEVEFESGEIKGYLDIRDGAGAGGDYKGIPYYIEKLNKLARVFARAFNEGTYADGTEAIRGHADGTGLDGSTGIRFFSFDGKSSGELMGSGTDMDSIYENITAANICVSSDIINDTDKIAAASTGGGTGNSDIIAGLVAMFSDKNVFAEGVPEDYINAIISTMGVDAAHAGRLSKNYGNILGHLDNSRASVSQVSLDEETANLIRYQEAYNCSAKMISVLDEILDVTINGLGAG